MILSAAVVDRDGSIYVARQFCVMTKAKVQALYLAFSRLVNTAKQHTIIDTTEVRYIYRAINDFYCVLITDKHSNILEDMKTLNLFTSATMEYASTGKGISEESLTEHRFDLLLVFDEIISMGIRQIDNLAQLRTVMAMESEMERLEIENRKKKERQAKAKAAEKSKQLDVQRRNEMLRQSETATTGRISSSSYKTAEPVVETSETEPTKPARVISRGRALKLKPKK